MMAILITAIYLTSFKSMNLMLLFVTAVIAKIFSNKKNFIISLLLLEVLSMMNFFVLILASTFFSGALFITMITIMVAEAILGLSIMVFMSRQKSSEIMSLI